MTEVIVCPLLVKCLGYLDPDSLWQVCLLSKEFEDMVRNNPGIEIKLIQVLEISPDKNKHDAGRIDRLIDQLYQLCNRLQQYQVMHVINVNNSKDQDCDELGRFGNRHHI